MRENSTDSEKSNSNDHHEMMLDFKRRFFFSLILTVPVIIFAPFFQNLFGYSFQSPTINWLLLVLASIIYFYGGYPFLRGLIREVTNGQPGMMTLIGLAISVAFIYSVSVTLGLEGKTFYWELASLIDIMLLGHWIEMRSLMGASRALEELAKLIPSSAHLVTEEGIKDIPSDELVEGNRVLVKPGEKIPSDGKVIKGETTVNETMITGESKPVLKEVDSQVIGGSINNEGSVTVEIEATGDQTYLMQIMRMVKDAQSSKSQAQDLANRAAFWLTIIAIASGVTTFSIWLLVGESLVFSIERMVTVMVITCPHALGLAIPLVIAVSTSASAKHGILIRTRTAFENLRSVNVVVFDKTGTLTEGSFAKSRTSLLSTLLRRKKLLSTPLP